jgi:hypothetical protein
MPVEALRLNDRIAAEAVIGNAVNIGFEWPVLELNCRFSG